MIQLSNSEKKIIKLTKNHYNYEGSSYPFTGDWHKTFQPLFDEIFGWSSEDDYEHYKSVLFFYLFDIWNKIKDSNENNDYLLKDIIKDCLYKSIGRPQEEPIERGIASLAGKIQNIRVIDQNGNKRFDLDLPDDI